jgi:diguanylate cyclase (GGDEF)-like protein
MKQALDESISLMDREYYSMKLVIEALGYKDYPQVLRGIELSSEDKALSSDAKMDKAQSMLLDEDYYSQKDRIRSSMSKSREALILATQQSEVELGQALEYDLTVVKVMIAVLVFIFLLSIGITIALAVNPILQAVKSIRADSQIPLVGASEFRYLAKAYNKMFEQHQSNIEQLSYKASHDALTKVYNRSGYELLLSSIDWKRIFYLLIDIDDFKHVNDTQGHEMGDEVLQYVASSIQRQFRNDDYICRIGGDEFAVLMTDADPSQWKLVEKKIDRINRDLMEASEDLALVSVSAGVVHGSDASTVEELYEYADEALYERKSAGKHGCTFYKQGAPVSSL